MIGKIVTVTVDRAMGTYHPEYSEMYYPINYGYIEGIMAPDSEEQDAYILGVDDTVDYFTEYSNKRSIATYAKYQ